MGLNSQDWTVLDKSDTPSVVSTLNWIQGSNTFMEKNEIHLTEILSHIKFMINIFIELLVL